MPGVQDAGHPHGTRVEAFFPVYVFCTWLERLCVAAAAAAEGECRKHLHKFLQGVMPEVMPETGRSGSHPTKEVSRILEQDFPPPECSFEAKKLVQRLSKLQATFSTFQNVFGGAAVTPAVGGTNRSSSRRTGEQAQQRQQQQGQQRQEQSGPNNRPNKIMRPFRPHDQLPAQFAKLPTAKAQAILAAMDVAEADRQETRLLKTALAVLAKSKAQCELGGRPTTAETSSLQSFLHLLRLASGINAQGKKVLSFWEHPGDELSSSEAAHDDNRLDN